MFFWVFGPEACGILAPRPVIKPTPPALEGEVLTTGPPGKSLNVFKKEIFYKPQLKILSWQDDTEKIKITKYVNIYWEIQHNLMLILVDNILTYLPTPFAEKIKFFFF